MSFAHGRNYSTSFPRSADSAHPDSRRLRFVCTSPSGSRFAKTVANGRAFKTPVALFYQIDGKWALQTVVDRGAMPEWAKNYTQGKAET